MFARDADADNNSFCPQFVDAKADSCEMAAGGGEGGVQGAMGLSAPYQLGFVHERKGCGKR